MWVILSQKLITICSPERLEKIEPDKKGKKEEGRKWWTREREEGGKEREGEIHRGFRILFLDCFLEG